MKRPIECYVGAILLTLSCFPSCPTRDLYDGVRGEMSALAFGCGLREYTTAVREWMLRASPPFQITLPKRVIEADRCAGELLEDQP